MLGAALAGCSSTPPGTLDTLSVSLVQQRGDISTQRAQLHLQNGADAPLTVSAARLASAVLPDDAVWGAARTVTIAPGRAVNLPVPLAGVECSADPPDPTARLSVDDGTGAREVETAVTDELGVLARLSASACDEDAVAAVATVTAAAVTPVGDGTAALRLDIVPAASGDGVLELRRLEGTPLLRVAGDAPLDVWVSAGDAPTTASVLVEPQRCDAHAIAEDKVGTIFTLVVALDGRQVSVPLTRAPGVAGDLLAYVAHTCGL